MKKRVFTSCHYCLFERNSGSNFIDYHEIERVYPEVKDKNRFEIICDVHFDVEEDEENVFLYDDSKLARYDSFTLSFDDKRRVYEKFYRDRYPFKSYFDLCDKYKSSHPGDIKKETFI